MIILVYKLSALLLLLSGIFPDSTKISTCTLDVVF